MKLSETSEVPDLITAIPSQQRNPERLNIDEIKLKHYNTENNQNAMTRVLDYYNIK